MWDFRPCLAGRATRHGLGMETLILGRPGAERTDLIRKLTDEGMSVHTCHDDAWGCAGLRDECPFDLTPVDAAVAIAPPGEALDPQGVACAQRARVPLVTVGGMEGDPVHRLADAELTAVDDSVAVIVASAARTANRHRRAIEEASTEFLREGEQLSVDVQRTATTLHVSIGGRFSEERISTIADQVHTAVRRFDRSASVIDVSVDRDALDTTSD